MGHAGEVHAEAVDEDGPTRLEVKGRRDIFHASLRVHDLIEAVLQDEVVHVVIAAVRPLVLEGQRRSPLPPG